MTGAARPSCCAQCARPVHPRGTRADDRPANSVLYRGNQLCVECAPARTTTGPYGRFQMHHSHLTTSAPARTWVEHASAELDTTQDGAR